MQSHKNCLLFQLYYFYHNLYCIHTSKTELLPLMHNLMTSLLKLTERNYFVSELKIFLNIQLRVICAHMVDFCMPSHKCVSFVYAQSYSATVVLVDTCSSQSWLVSGIYLLDTYLFPYFLLQLLILLPLDLNLFLSSNLLYSIQFSKCSAWFLDGKT